VRQVDNAEPQLLDIVEIPLAAEGPHRDTQPENYKILNGAWKRVGKATVTQVAKYCQKAGMILYNVDRRIHMTDLCKVAEEDRKSLCMVRANVNFSTGTSPQGKKRVFASFAHAHDQYRIPVTDYDFEHDFRAFETREAECLLTVSLGSPYERDNYCYKFVAGVIEV
jgi:hypothetical protein